MEKEEALLKFLKHEDEDITLEDLEQCSYDSNSFEVNPRSTRHGSSPTAVKENAERVRKALHSVFGHVIKTDELKSSDITERFYKLFNKYFMASIWPPTDEERKHDNEKARAYQDIVNFLYWQYAGGDLAKPGHQLAAIQAFDGEEVQEYRPLTPTNSGEYLVLTDDEADEAARERSESYIDDCLEIPEHLENYFDREKFVKDSINIDGRGHIISGYDGEEHEEEGFYIYRTN